MQPHRPARRTAFTLVELLVCVTIVALLLALILPAVLSSRAAARSLGCRNNLRQIGVAMHGYEATWGCFPPGNLEFKPGQIRMLPYLGRQTLFDYAMGQPEPDGEPVAEPNSLRVDVYQCPVDRALRGETDWFSYFGNTGANGLPDSRDQGTYFASAKRLRGGAPPIVRPAYVKDGLSQTAAYAEGIPAISESRAGLPWVLSTTVPLRQEDQPRVETVRSECVASDRRLDPRKQIYSRGDYWYIIDNTQYDHIMTPNTRSCIFDQTADGLGSVNGGTFNAASLHPGGVNLLNADGAVEWIDDGVDAAVWLARGTANGNEAW